jgi:hypothetical protein
MTSLLDFHVWMEQQLEANSLPIRRLKSLLGIPTEKAANDVV